MKAIPVVRNLIHLEDERESGLPSTLKSCPTELAVETGYWPTNGIETVLYSGPLFKIALIWSQLSYNSIAAY